MTTDRKKTFEPFYMETKDIDDVEHLKEVLDSVGIELYFQPGVRSLNLPYICSTVPSADRVIFNDTSLGRGRFKLNSVEELAAHVGCHLPNPSHPLRNVKLRVKDEEHSRAFQEAVFESRGERFTEGMYKRNINFLYCEGDGFLAYGTTENLFKSHGYKEIEFNYERTLTCDIKPVLPPVREVVNLEDGRSYYKDDLDKALSSLTPVSHSEPQVLER